MEKHFQRTFFKEERTDVLRVHLNPDTPVASPPKLDQFMMDFAGKRLDKSRDTQNPDQLTICWLPERFADHRKMQGRDRTGAYEHQTAIH